jgi:hypothetical protein
MGEYILLDGETCKLGTCESLYYVRYSDLARWVAEGRTERAGLANAEPADYLKGAYRFRFPFPDEDAAPDGPARGDYYWEHDSERGELLPAPPAVLELADKHYSVSAQCEVRTAEIERVHWTLPCPVGPETDEDTHTPPTRGYVYLVAQRPCAGALWPVVKCAYCFAMWRIPPAIGAQWAAHIRESWPMQQPNAYGLEAVARIEAGYQTPTGAPGAVTEATP